LKPERVPQVAIDIVLEQMPATLAFFRGSLPAAFDKAPNGQDKEAFREANARLIAAIEDYGKWLSSTLRPHARGGYAIGADAYRRMLAAEDMVDTPSIGSNRSARRRCGACRRNLPRPPR
jgi:hypothetical protein